MALSDRKNYGQKSTEITMGLPVYNEEQSFLEETIESLLVQSFENFKLIISDNASTDRTSEICKEYSQRDGRITFIEQEKNLGQLENFRFVRDAADTRYFMWCGSHDLWDPEYIKKLLPIIKSRDLAVVYPRTQYIYPDGTYGRIWKEDITTEHINDPANRYIITIKKLVHCMIFHGIWKSEIVKRCNLVNVISMDKLFMAEASLEGKFKQVDDVLFYRRINRPNESQRNMLARQVRTIPVKGRTEQSSIFSLQCDYILEHLKLLFRRRGSLGNLKFIKLALYTIFIVSFKRFNTLLRLKKLLRSLTTNSRERSEA